MGFATSAMSLLLTNNWFKLNSHPLPIVDSYTYLGIPFSSRLTQKSFFVAWAESDTKALIPLIFVLSCNLIPIQLN